jgi:hypothetical protein
VIVLGDVGEIDDEELDWTIVAITRLFETLQSFERKRVSLTC